MSAHFHSTATANQALPFRQAQGPELAEGQPIVARFPPRPAWSASGVLGRRCRAGSAPVEVRAGKKFILRRPARWMSLGRWATIAFKTNGKKTGY